jgi:hypothetical protein
MATVSKYFHTDPSHGWLAVKRKELEELGIAGMISNYSYEKGSTVYLEEDVDAGIYVKAKSKTGVTVTFKESFREHSPIRGYKKYSKGMKYEIPYAYE